MSEIVIYFQYDGEWKEKDDGSYEWCRRNKEIKSIILLDDPDKVKYSEVIDCIFKRLHVDQKSTELKISYIPLCTISSGPKSILDDFDAKCYLLDFCKTTQRRSMLHVELLKKVENSDDNDKDGLEVEGDGGCNLENDGNIRDEYFDVNMEPPRVYDAASAPGNEGDVFDVPTLEERPNQETTASAPTPKRQRSCVEVDPVMDHCEPLAIDDSSVSFSFDDGMGIAVGQEFESKNEVKNLIIDASLKACFDYKIVKSTTKLFVVKCTVQDCKWALRAVRITNSDRFSLRTYYNTHTCSASSVDKRNRQATADLVSDMLKKEFPGQLETPTPKRVIDMMKNRGVSISYFKAWRGKRKAASDVRGAPEVSFEILPSYLHMIKLMNPGTVTHLEVDEDQRFKYLFIALGACIEGFKAMRKVIAVDGTFLKTKYKGTMIIATAQDGNYHQYPLAWGVVDSENDNSWNWFMTKLEELIPDDEELVIISDRHQSIRNAVEKVYKKSHYGFCAWHLSQNIKSRVHRGTRVRVHVSSRLKIPSQVFS